MLDLTPAAGQAAGLLAGIRDEHLTAPTPCEKWQVAQVLDHLMGLSHAFTAGARKTPAAAGGAPEPTAELPAGWREELPQRLGELAEAWAQPSAWQGLASVGGVEMPGAVCGLVALDEVVVHSWDLARATGQTLTVDPGLVAALDEFWSAQSGPDDDLPLRSVIFGPVVPVPGEAPQFDRVLGLTGRDPHWPG